MIPEFPGNTDRSKEAKSDKPEKAEKVVKNTEKVVTGEVTKRKRPLTDRFRGVFLSGDARNAGNYIVMDVLLPALRNMVVDSVQRGVERMVYGEVDPRSRRRSEPGRPRVQYSNPFERSPQPRGVHLPDQPVRGRGRRMDNNEIILASRDEAELVIERMGDIVDQFQFASLADLNDLIGLPTNYVDDEWGWSDVRYMDVRQIREGYLLLIPPMEPKA